jgi:hypothetical protein
MLMELEDLSNRYAGYEILKIIITQSDGLAVLLGKNLQSPQSLTPQFTHNWVNFEVGAAGIGKRVGYLKTMKKISVFQFLM